MRKFTSLLLLGFALGSFALPSARKESPVHNNTNAIRTDNLVRRLLRLPQRDGSDHAGGKDIVSPYSLPYTK